MSKKMNTEIIKISSSFEESQLAPVAQILIDGGLVVFPTETVYGLGGKATDSTVAQKIYSAKGRPSNNPLIIHIAAPEDAEQYAVTNEYYYMLAKAFMPGPLTIILPKKNTIPSEVTGGLDTVAVRCPSHPVAQALIRQTGYPIAAPSANISGRPSPTSAQYCIEDLNGKVDMIIDGGECDIGLESTIVLLKGSTAVLLRPGAITYDALCCVCESVELSQAAQGSVSENERPMAPGMMYRHYAPSAPFVLIDGDMDAFIPYIMSRRSQGERCAVICSEQEAQQLGNIDTVIYGDPRDLATQARRLFSALREADALGCTTIYARKPILEGLGLALYNRMIRAASHTVIKI